MLQENLVKNLRLRGIEADSLGIPFRYEPEVLRPPLNNEALFEPEAYEPYIFCGGRINGGKRQFLLAEAMAHVRSKVKLVIAGPPDTPADGEEVLQAVRRSGSNNIEA